MAVTAIVETIIAGHGICKAYKMWKNGVISREKFIKEVTDIVLLALFRSGRSFAGMLVGQLVIPVPVVGELVGAVLGVLGGHACAKFLPAKFSETLASFIDQAKPRAASEIDLLTGHAKSFIYGLKECPFTHQKTEKSA